MVTHFHYSKFATLKNGKRLEIRLPRDEDRDGLIKLLQRTPKEEVQFCKEDVKDLGLLDGWLRSQNSQRLIFLVAIDLEEFQPVASINLRCGQHTDVKVGEILQILVDKPFQGFGLGSMLLDSLIFLAAMAKLHWLKAEVVTDLKNVLRAFSSRGFQTKTILEDYFTDARGKTYDVALMMLSLQEQK